MAHVRSKQRVAERRAANARALASTVLSSAAAPRGAVVTHAEITDVVRIRHKVEYRARHDQLSGLANQTEYREAGDRIVQHRLHGAVRSHDGNPVTVPMIDLDDVKSINDRYGHAIGDVFGVPIRPRAARAPLGGGRGDENAGR